jgi:hypothetical protein
MSDNIKNNINDIYANRTGGFLNQSNNFQKLKDEEIRNDKRTSDNSEKTVCFQSERKTKDYQLNMEQKANEENSKRKPFDKFNFK